MRLTSMGIDLETKQASLLLMSSFTGKSGHWAQQDNEALYSLNSITQLVDLVRFGFVIKDYQAENLNLLVKLEQVIRMFPITLKISMTTIVFGYLKFPEKLGPIVYYGSSFLTF